MFGKSNGETERRRPGATPYSRSIRPAEDECCAVTGSSAHILSERPGPPGADTAEAAWMPI